MGNSVRGGEGPAAEIIISITISLTSLPPALPFIFFNKLHDFKTNLFSTLPLYG